MQVKQSLVLPAQEHQGSSSSMEEKLGRKCIEGKDTEGGLEMSTQTSHPHVPSLRDEQSPLHQSKPSFGAPQPQVAMLTCFSLLFPHVKFLLCWHSKFRRPQDVQLRPQANREHIHSKAHASPIMQGGPRAAGWAPAPHCTGPGCPHRAAPCWCRAPGRHQIKFKQGCYRMQFLQPSAADDFCEIPSIPSTMEMPLLGKHWSQVSGILALPSTNLR